MFMRHRGSEGDLGIIFLRLSCIANVTMLMRILLVSAAALISEVIVSADPGPQQQRKRETSKGLSINDVSPLVNICESRLIHSGQFFQTPFLTIQHLRVI